MFENIINRNKNAKEKKQQDVNAQNEQQFAREQTALTAAVESDQSYMHMREDKLDLTRWQQDLEDTIEDLRHNLMNQVKTDEGWKQDVEYYKDAKGKVEAYTIKSMVNSQGTYKLISVVKRYLNRNFMMSNLSEEIIFRMLRRLRIDLVINLGSKYEQYEIDPDDLSIVVKMIVDSVEATLYRALKNGERSYLNTINKRVETFNSNPQVAPTKKGFLGGVFT